MDTIIKFCHYIAFDDGDSVLANREGDHVQACICVEFDLQTLKGTLKITGTGTDKDGSAESISGVAANIKY